MAYSAIFQGCLRTAVSVKLCSLQLRRELVKATPLRPRHASARLRAAPCLKRRAVLPMCFAGPALEAEWRQRNSAALQLLSRQRSDYYSRFAYQDLSSDESDLELGPAKPQLGQSTLENVENWKVKFNMLLRNKEERELVSREKKDRRDFERLADLAAMSNLHCRQYSKVVVFSKDPLPNYRPDLDERRPQREVHLPVRLQKEVESRVKLHLSERLITGGSPLNKFSGLSPVEDYKAQNVQPERPIRNNIVLDKIHHTKSLQLRDKQQEWQESPDGQKMLEFRRSLPAYKERDALLKAIMENQVVVVSGETGCGKTTQLPQYILESEIEAARGATCSIICTQPRRISAISVSERVSAERGEKIGESVGYKIRMEGIKGRDTRLLFCTTGILLRRLLVDRDLTGVTHVIVDEIHERGMNEDFLLIVLKDLLPRRPDLRLILMSATMNAELFSSYFSGAPMFHIPGFTYPVRAHFLEDILETTGYRLTAYNQIDDYGQDKSWKMQKQTAIKKRKSQIASSVEDAFEIADLRGYNPRVRESLSCWNPDSIGFNLIERCLHHIVTRERPGAVLVFMTGWDDINSLKEQLQSDPILGDPSKVLLLACHGSMPSSEQKLIFDRPEDGVRKIVLATNMAETSITINDVVFVVDCGKAKETSYDALNNTPCLLPTWISKAAARQRRGRAGRVQPGECYHLYPRCVYESFIDYQMPELLRTPLQSLCLQIKSLQLGGITEFLSRALQPPESLSVQNAVENLTIIGALDEYENLTVLGRHLSMLPVEPKLGKMLIYGAIFNCLDPIMTVVAGLSVRDPFLMPFDKKDLAESAKAQFSGYDYSDHLAVVRAYEGWRLAESQVSRGGHEYCYRNFLSHHTLRAIDSLRKQFHTLLKDTGLVNFPDDNASSWAHDEHLVRAVLCAGLFPGVCSVVNKERSIALKTMEDGQVLLYSNSVNAAAPKIPYPWLVYNEKVKVNSVFLRDSTGISDSALLLFGGDILRGGIDGHLKMLGGYLEFFMNPSLSETYLTLRRELGELIQAKLLDPKFDIQTCSNLLMAVRQMISEDQCDGRFVFGRTLPKRATKKENPNILFGNAKNGVAGNHAKNELQTLLQRAGHDAPAYKTKPLKNNQFRSTVIFNGLDFTGHPCNSKKQAEKEAAAQALLFLKGETGSPSSAYDHASMLLVKDRKRERSTASGSRFARRH